MPIFYGFLNTTPRGLKLQVGSWIHNITWVCMFNVERDTSARGEVKLVTSLEEMLVHASHKMNETFDAHP